MTPWHTVIPIPSAGSMLRTQSSITVRSDLRVALTPPCDYPDSLAALAPYCFLGKTENRIQCEHRKLLVALRTRTALLASSLTDVMRSLGLPLDVVVSSIPYRVVLHRPCGLFWALTGGRGLVSWFSRGANRHQIGHRGDPRSGIGPVGGFSFIAFDRIYPRLFAFCGPHRQDGYRSEDPG